MIIFLSVKCFTVFISMKLLIGCLKTFQLEMVGVGQIGKSTYAMGVVASINVHTMGEGGIFAILVCLY